MHLRHLAVWLRNLTSSSLTFVLVVVTSKDLSGSLDKAGCSKMLHLFKVDKAGPNCHRLTNT